MTTSDTNIPTGYRQNAHGHLIPVDQIKEIDLAHNLNQLDLTS